MGYIAAYCAGCATVCALWFLWGRYRERVNTWLIRVGGR